ncbi:MAG: hypothetical protein M1817_006356 [Caeruleum heppii]|nr:MAG: hypothetical protein M1817_006356 [Caeruleum heppii]
MPPPPSSFPGSFPEPVDSTSPSTVSNHHSLTEAVRARRAEYTRTRTTRIKIGTWNVAALHGTERDLGGWFVDGKGVAEALAGLNVHSAEEPHSSHPRERLSDQSDRESVGHQESRATKKASTIPRNDHASVAQGDEIGIYALGLQEVVDIGWTTESLRPFSDPTVSHKWRKAVSNALPPGYALVAEQQLTGILLLIYASPAIAPTISSVSTTHVGTGLLGYMGNKGGAVARILLGETTRLVFINCHLAAGVEKGALERRNWDAAQILSRTRFDPVERGGVVEDTGEGIGDEDFAWWFGDLNYRLEDIPGDEVRRLLMLHTRNEYDIGERSERKIEQELSQPHKPIDLRDEESKARSSSDGQHASSARRSTEQKSDRSSLSSSGLSSHTDDMRLKSDPETLAMTISSLLQHDQLYAQQAARKAFHEGWREGEVRFLPTYKYDVGSVGMFDSGEKKRGPSWCDRILYRTRSDRLRSESKAAGEAEAKKRDAEMKARGVDQDDDLLYDYDPETDGAEEIEDHTDHVKDEHASNGDLVVTEDGFEDRLELEVYASHQRVLSSDHKPLTAVFKLTYDAVVPELRAQVHQDVARELDKVENESRPDVTIVVDHHGDDGLGVREAHSHPSSPDTVDFGQASYREEKTRGVTIANTSRVPARVTFVEQPCPGEGTSKGDPWLDVRYEGGDGPGRGAKPDSHDQQHTIEPGEALNVVLNLKVADISLVKDLNEGREQLQTVLVLRVEQGRDHFLPVKGNWLPSSFGRTVEELIRVPEAGVRSLPHSPGLDQLDVRWSAPRELLKLTEAIEQLVERVMAEWGMTNQENHAPWEKFPGWPFDELSWSTKDSQIRDIRRLYVHEALDAGKPVLSLLPDEATSLERLEILSGVLVDFLSSMRDGIIPEAIWAEIERRLIALDKSRQSQSAEEERTWILDVLSAVPHHHISFIFLTTMLARVAGDIAPLPVSSSPNPPHSPSTPRKSTDLPSSSMNHFPHRPRGKSQSLNQPTDPNLARHGEAVEKAYAAIFGDVMVRGGLPARAKERLVAVGRRRGIIEVFLRGRDGG